MKRIVAQILIYFSPALALVAKDMKYTEMASMPKTEESVLPQAELKLKGSDWTKENVTKLLTMFNAVDVCVKFSCSMKDELDPMENAMEKLDNNFQELKNILNANRSVNNYREICAQLDLLDERIELLQSYYKDCYDELSVKKSEATSFAALLKYLQEFQQATEKFNNAVSRIIDQIKKLKKDSKTLSAYRDLKPIKKELKAMQTASESLTNTIKSITEKAKNVSEIFHERSFAERQKLHQSQKSRRSI